MDVIIIHGPPSVGKFTVAEKLSKITGYKLIHIHSIYDFLESIFSKERYEVSLKILNKIYLDVLEESAKLNFQGVIFTYAHIAQDNFGFLKKLKKVLNKYDSRLRAVQLTCDKEELKKRVVAESRKKFNKTHTIKELEYLFSIKDYESTFSEIKTITIDNTKLSPSKVAQKIKQEFSI